jgi:hypothetical protein
MRNKRFLGLNKMFLGLNKSLALSKKPEPLIKTGSKNSFCHSI